MMVKKKCFFGKAEPQPDTTKELILEAARNHFCEKGFEGASVREICDQAKANVSAIKYHFGGKEGLYRECFKVYGETRLNSASKILTDVNSLDELKLRLKLFAEDFIKEGLENITTTKMICREIETENPLIEDIFTATFLKVYTTMVSMFENAQKKNLIRKDIDPMILTSLFFHSITTSLRVDHVGEKYFNKTLRNPEYSEQFINNMISIFFDGIKSQE
jgi:TetR/AcrR family transcriptional regulator